MKTMIAPMDSDADVAKHRDALRSIIVRHTRIGGYPDTMAIARDAWILGAACGAAAGSAPKDATSAVTTGSPEVVTGEVPAIDWEGDLVAVHMGGPVKGSPAQLMEGTVVKVQAFPTCGGTMTICGIPGFVNYIGSDMDGRTRTHWRIRNAET